MRSKRLFFGLLTLWMLKDTNVDPRESLEQEGGLLRLLARLGKVNSILEIVGPFEGAIVNCHSLHTTAVASDSVFLDLFPTSFCVPKSR